MTAPSRKTFRRETADQRRGDLIAATIRVIAKLGLTAATVRAIADEADVTQGLIRHHFSTKEDLIAAAYEAHMSAMTNHARDAANGVFDSGVARLAAFVTASLISPVAGPSSIAVWAGFLPQIPHQAEFAGVHRRTYLAFRDHLEALIAAARTEAGLTDSADNLRALAITCGSIIDGLWLEAGLLPEAFEAGEIPRLGLRSIGKLVDLPTLETHQTA